MLTLYDLLHAPCEHLELLGQVICLQQDSEEGNLQEKEVCSDRWDILKPTKDLVGLLSQLNPTQIVQHEGYQSSSTPSYPANSSNQRDPMAVSQDNIKHII